MIKMSQHLLSADEVLDNSGIGSDEAYYAGCSARLSSINGTHLCRIYEMILADRGAEAASSFTQMILEMENLAPQLVIRAIRKLEKCDWKLSQEWNINQNPYIPSPVDPDSKIQFCFGNAALFFDSGTDETKDIKEDFKRQLLGCNSPEIVTTDCKVCQHYRERGCLKNPQYQKAARLYENQKQVNSNTAKFLTDGCFYWKKRDFELLPVEKDLINQYKKLSTISKLVAYQEGLKLEVEKELADRFSQIMYCLFLTSRVNFLLRSWSLNGSYLYPQLSLFMKILNAPFIELDNIIEFGLLFITNDYRAIVDISERMRNNLVDSEEAESYSHAAALLITKLSPIKPKLRASDQQNEG